jgi:hypothetical protein
MVCFFFFFCGGLWVVELELLDTDVCWSPELSLWLSSTPLDELLTDGCLGLLEGFFFFFFSFL